MGEAEKARLKRIDARIAKLRAEKREIVKYLDKRYRPPTQTGRILLMLDKENELDVQGIAERLQAPRSSVTSLLSILNYMEGVKRVRHGVYRITDKGREKAQEIREQFGIEEG